MVREPKSYKDKVIPCRLLFIMVITLIDNIEYKTIPYTDGRYKISENGEIWDNKRNTFIAQHKSKRGWLQCHIWLKGKRITINVHRLVMLAFVGDSDLTVNHKDGNKENNNINNLEYMTIKEQNQHRSYVLKVGNRVPVRCIETGKEYDTIKSACEDLGINPDNAHISEVISHKYGFKTSHGYHFERI